MFLNFERARALAELKATRHEAKGKDQSGQESRKQAERTDQPGVRKEAEARQSSRPAQRPIAQRPIVQRPVRPSFRDAEARVVKRLRHAQDAVGDADDGVSLPGAVSRRPRCVSISTIAKDGVGLIDHHAERRKIEESISSSYSFHNTHGCVINPTKRFRTTWNMLLTLMLFYVALAVPYRVGFAINLAPFSFSFWVDLLVEIVFIVDIVLNFFTGIPHDFGYIEMRPSKIRQTYFHGWFVVDLLASIPLRGLSLFVVDYESVDEAEQTRILKVLRLLRITRLLQLGKLRFMFISHADFFHKIARYGKFTGLMLALMYCCHVFGCIWFFFGTLDNDGPVANPDSWIAHRGIANSTLQVKYITSFYWAVTALSTVGFGDISASTRFEMIFASFTVMVGTVFFAVMISQLGDVIRNQSVLSEKTTRQLDELSQFLVAKQLPKNLRNRVRMFLEITYRDEAFDSQAMLQKLPWELQDQVRRHIFASILNEMPLFGGIQWSQPDDEQLNQEEFLMNLLCNEFKPVNVMAGQQVYQEGEIGGEFYCITRGAVVLTSAFGYKREMAQGDFFGERELFFSRRFEDAAADSDDQLPWSSPAQSKVFGGQSSGRGLTRPASALPIQGRRRHQTATCINDAELKFIKWPQLLLLKQGGAVGMAVYNRIADAATARAAEDSEVTQRRSNRTVRVVELLGFAMTTGSVNFQATAGRAYIDGCDRL